MFLFNICPTEEHKVLIERAYVAVMSIIARRSNVRSRQVKDYLLPNATIERETRLSGPILENCSRQEGKKLVKKG